MQLGDDDISYLLTAEKYGYPLRKIIPNILKERCFNQDWPGLKIIDEHFRNQMNRFRSTVAQLIVACF